MTARRMMRNTNELSFILTLIILAFVPLRVAAAESSDSKLGGYTSICDIYNKNFSSDKILLLRATYTTDGGSYAYFKEKHSSTLNSCKGKNIIDIDRIPNMKDDTVVKFFKDASARCERKHMALCGFSANMEFEAKVLVKASTPILHLTKIKSYKYIAR